MSDKNTNTDNTDEPSKAELHDRVEKLESTVAKMMPSRRDALKLGAAGLAGAAGLSATSGSAEASTGSAGQIGDPNNRPDVFADTVDIDNIGVAGFVSSNQSISANTPTKVRYDAVRHDDQTEFDTAANEFTAADDGDYAIYAQTEVQNASANDFLRLAIMVNGSRERRGQKQIVGGTEYISVTAQKLRLTAGDTVFFRFENTSSPCRINGFSGATYFDIVQLG